MTEVSLFAVGARRWIAPHVDFLRVRTINEFELFGTPPVERGGTAAMGPRKGAYRPARRRRV